MKKLCLLLALILTAGTLSAHAATFEDRLQIEDAITDISAGADRHDWKRVRRAMAETIATDYTGLWGGTPVTQPADELITTWRNFLPGFDATQHLISGQTIRFEDETHATAESDFQATHRIDKKLWVLGGRYIYQFIKQEGRWRITSLTMIPVWETGDRGLTAIAGEKAQQKENNQ